MNEKISAFFDNFKSKKIIVILGIIGIALIFISSVLPENKPKEKTENTDISTYTENLQTEVQQMVKKITGAKRVSVVITLDTGITYNYADELKTADTDKTSSGSSDMTYSSEQKKTIITDAEGNQRAVIINEYLPLVRGVAVVYSGENDESANEKISAALKAALAVSTKQIFIYGNGGK